MEEVRELIHQVEELLSAEDAESDEEISGNLWRCSRTAYTCCGPHLSISGHPFHRCLGRGGVDGEHFLMF